MFWLVRDIEKTRLEAKREKAPSCLRQRQTHTDSKFSHKEILLLLETKPILNVIDYQVKVHWLFIFPRNSLRPFYCFFFITEILPFESIWSVAYKIFESIWSERIRYGFEDRHPAGKHLVPEKRGKYWSTAFLAAR